jgi:hypothetical protein
MQSIAFAQYGGNATTVCVVEARDKSGQPMGTGGKGFALRIGGRDFFVTTAHGMCEILGPSAQPSTMFDTIGSVVLRNLANEEIGTAGRCLVTGSLDARYNTDILAFDLPYGVRLQSMYLAPTLAAPGTRVWVLSKDGHNFSNNAEIDKYPGTVVSSTLSALSVRMDAPLTALHSSGSPVVDAKNQVVGMLCGVGAERKTIGCNPGLAIYQRLGLNSRATTPARAPTGVQTYR